MSGNFLERARGMYSPMELEKPSIQNAVNIMASLLESEIKAERLSIADDIKMALSSEFIDNSPSAFRSRFHTIENKLRSTVASQPLELISTDEHLSEGGGSRPVYGL